MAKYKPKTEARDTDPLRFIDKVKSDVKRKDSHELVALMQDITDAPPKMWGPSIVGFGSYHYVYASGRAAQTGPTRLNRARALRTFMLIGHDVLLSS